jgi:hypothetical protein
MSAATLFRSPGGRVCHLLSKTCPGLTRCGVDATKGARFSPSDLPSGTRQQRVCEKCRTKETATEIVERVLADTNIRFTN